jgi:LCP family protein required for cell wall assembly
VTEDGQTETAAPTDARPRRRLRNVLLVLLALALLVVATVVVAGVKLTHQIRKDDAFDDIVDKRPQQYVDPDGGKPVNILLMGQDRRAGKFKRINGETPGLSDTTILLHLSADRQRAYAVSIPRDLMVQRPSCRDRDTGETLPASGPEMWNAAFALGGPACTIAQFEEMTGILVNHFAVLDFESVVQVANALGGVPVCVPEEVDVPSDSVYLPAGRYEAKGDVALSYVRARRFVGDGSDVGRMMRQQAFLAALVRKATSIGTLANPVKAYRVLDAATRSFATDPDLAKVTHLVGMARAIRHIGLDKIQFLTMPIGPYAPDPNRLAVGPGADQMWSQLERDQKLDARFTAEAATPAESLPPRGSAAPLGVDPLDYGMCPGTMPGR